VNEKQTELTGELIPKGLPATALELIDLGESIGKALYIDVVTNDEDMENISTAMQQCAAHVKTLENMRKDHLRPIREYVEKVNAEYKRATDVIDRGLRHAKAEVSSYQHRVREQIRKEAAAEAARIAKNAEKRAERIEKKAAASEDTAAAAEAAAEAENIRMQAEVKAQHAAAAIATQEAPKAKGVSSSKNWKIEVIDKKAFIGSVASGDDPRLTLDMVKVNQPELNKLAKALKEGCQGIKGARVYYDEIVSVRSSK